MPINYAVTFHAVLIIAMPVITLAVLLLRKRRLPKWRSLLLAVGVAVVMSVLLSLTRSEHACDAGHSYDLSMIGVACVFLILAFDEGKFWRRNLAVVFVMLTFRLQSNSVDLVHEDGWTGNSKCYGYTTRRALRDTEKQLLAYVETNQLTKIEYPAGWLCDLPVWTGIAEVATRNRDRLLRGIVSPAWHTWLTGLYSVEYVPQDFWHPGGCIDKHTLRLELRDKSPTSRNVPASQP